MQLRARGRPSIVVGRRCPPELLEHEVWVTEAELLLGVDFDRTATIDKAVPDGAFTREGDNYAVEVDNAGKQSRKQYRQKWAKYGRFGGYILVLCHTERRMNSVLEWSEAVKSAVLATTFGRLAAGKPWTDWYGSTAEI